MALGSILEAPGLDFKGFWDRFFENVRRFLGSFGKKVFLTSRFGLVGSVLNSWRFGVRFFEVVISQTKSRVCQKSQERQVPKSGQIVAKIRRLGLPGRSQN